MILPHNIENNEIVIHCVATQGYGICGKRQCRGDARKQLVEQLESQAVEKLRAQIAGDMMQEGDVNEPPFLYTASVMRNSLYEYKKLQFRHPDPLVALKC